MFARIIVGVDEHGGGGDAIALARKLLARGGEFTPAHVLAHDGHGYRGARAACEASGWERAAELLEKARADAGVDAHLRWCVSASVGRGLHELCEVIGAELLAVGSSRRGLPGRVPVGDHTRSALNGARCAIAIAPTGYSLEPVTMREIGVGYDGSPESEHAFELARRLAAETGAKLSAFEAVSLPGTSLDANRLPLRDAVDALVEGARDRIAAAYGPVGRLVNGSTSSELARMARCPLLVLPRSAHRIEGAEPVASGREPAVALKE